MTVKISNMEPQRGSGVATFDATFPGGWTIHRCVIIRRGNGDMAAVAPLVGSGVRAVTIPRGYWYEFIDAALDTFDEFEREQAVVVSAEHHQEPRP